eukprot:3478788-Prorocentrum_lima.AAC.1
MRSVDAPSAHAKHAMGAVGPLSLVAGRLAIKAGRLHRSHSYEVLDLFAGIPLVKKESSDLTWLCHFAYT